MKINIENLKPGQKVSEIEGQNWEKVLTGVNFGNGFASYALFRGVWYSVNACGDKVQDVRWTASDTERDQIVAVLKSRLNR